MSQEIIEAVREIERDKGIEEGALVAALEDALLAAYKKTAGAARHAVVEMDGEGDFRVFAIELPQDLEERLLDEARERKLEELEKLEEETGERTGVRAAGGYFIRQQALIEGERPLPLFKFRIERLSETAGPHFHRSSMPDKFFRPLSGAI